MRSIPLILGALLALAGCQSQHPELSRSMWFWHSPFRLSQEESEALRRMKVDELFVLAGTVSNSLDGPKATLPQRWAPTEARFDIHLVVPFDRGIVQHFEELDLSSLANTVMQIVAESKEKAEKQGHTVLGLQLDFDCPTRLLSRYSALLRLVRKGLGSDHKLSIASLATWLSSSEFREVLEPLDFYIPQFYEGELPKTLADFKPIATLPSLEAGIRKAELIGKPYRIGLPAYGHALLFEKEGKLSGTLRGLSPSQAAKREDMEWTLTTSFDENGKPSDKGEAAQLVVFQHSGSGLLPAYELPNSAWLARLIQAAQRQAGSKCEGLAIFRFPEEGEELSLPLAAIEASFDGDRLPFEIEAEWRVESSPWQAIEGSGPRVLEVILVVRNRGLSATRFAPDSIEATIEVEPAGFESVEAGDADRCTVGGGGVSLARAKTATFRLSRLAPGQDAAFGPIRVFERDGASITAIVKARNPEGTGVRTLELGNALSAKAKK